MSAQGLSCTQMQWRPGIPQQKAYCAGVMVQYTTGNLGCLRHMQIGADMKFFQEITEGDHYPNHVYLLSDNKEYMHGYVRAGSNILEMMKSKYRFGTTKRRFQEVPNTFGFVEPAEAPVADTADRWTVKGSRGENYVVERVGKKLICTCSGFKFRNKCKHTEVA